MKIYKVHIHSGMDSSFGFEYFTSKGAAERHKRENDNDDIDCEVEVIELKPTKASILAVLNQHASHADNG